MAEVDGPSRRAGKPVPFLGLDCFPPRHRQPDFVATRHENMPVIWKGMFPNPGAIFLLWRRVWKLAKCFEYLAEVWFMERMFQSEDAIRCRADIP